MVLPAIGLGLASAGLSFFGAKSSADRAHRQAKEQVRMQNMQAMQERNFQNLQIRKQNEYARQAYDTQVVCTSNKSSSTLKLPIGLYWCTS